MTRFRAGPRADLLVAPLDAFTALYHRPSGITHLLSTPAPELLDTMGEGEWTVAELAAALAARFDLERDDAALTARLEELVDAGLVERW
ncbi:HPr-rel-A system PqqD family peptide chaperone [Sphingomonas aracearum]|uniref:HPr-rel-A system PqqD family peptide chaperone n=1 Tax=Sphingomonas aracearum TaxID=2283317 RepID=UPI001EEFC7E0|nr:HPr-rel-A system PqqD family peptide chaperone [Sphingomonas aracearum]